jgi:hypothetical protein
MHCLVRNVGRKIQSLQNLPRRSEANADIPADTGCSDPIGDALNQIGIPRNITSRAGNPATRVFNQRSRNQIRSDLRWFKTFGEFAIAIVDHNRYICLRTQGFDCVLQAFNRQGTPVCIPDGSLPVNQLGVWGDFLQHTRKIGGSVYQICLHIKDLVFA